MTHTDTGTPGATAISWRKDNPRYLIERLCKKHGYPKTPEDTDFIANEYDKLLRNPDGTLTELGIEVAGSNFLYFATNTVKALVRERNRAGRTESEKKADAEAAEAEAEKLAAKIREAVLLDQVLSNGKKLRDCTKEDLVAEGGWFLRISDKLKPGEVAGKKLSEKAVRELRDAVV